MPVLARVHPTRPLSALDIDQPSRHVTMMFWLTLVNLCLAIPLTISVPANGRNCYYARTHQPDTNMAVSFHVMAGGSFDIDAIVKRPDGSVARKIEKASDDEFAFVANEPGEYELCFYNEMSTFADKKVEFEFEQENTYFRAQLPNIAIEPDTKSLESYIQSLESRITELTRSQQYYKTRNARNQSTVKSTESRIFWFCIFEIAFIVGLAVVNVTIVQYFFKGSRKNLV